MRKRQMEPIVGCGSSIADSDTTEKVHLRFFRNKRAATRVDSFRNVGQAQVRIEIGQPPPVQEMNVHTPFRDAILSLRSPPVVRKPLQRISPRLGTTLSLTSLLGLCMGHTACQTERAARLGWSSDFAAHLPEEERLPLDRLFAEPPLAGHAPQGLKMSPDGLRVSFLRPNEQDSEVLDLWAMDLPDGEPVVLVRTADLVAKDSIQLSEEERMALERKRITHQGITTYAYCGESGNALLFPLSGDLYHVTLGGAPQVRRLTQDGTAKLNPKCSPDGSRISFTRERDLYVIEVASGAETQIAHSTRETQSFGVAEFIAQEEMGRYEGAYWSADGRYLAFTEVDETPVSIKRRPFIYADRTEMYEQRYPAAGEPNATVSLFVYDFDKKSRMRIALPAGDGYLARVGFAGDGLLYAQWQQRDQKILTLLAGDKPTFELKPVIEEADDAWVEIHDDLRFFKDGFRFIWSSEREGVRRLYAGMRGLNDLTPITPPGEPILKLVGFDEDQKRIFYIRGLQRGMEHALFSVNLDGTDERRLTREAGVHQVSWGNGGLMIDKWSTFGVPPKLRLVDYDGYEVRMIDDNPAIELRKYAKPKVEFLTLSASDGTPLNGMLLEPIDRQWGKKYPVIVYVYGGPTAQLVNNGYARRYPFFIHLTQRGYGVLVVDNRGTANRDRAFTRAFLEGFGAIEISDQAQALRQVLAQTEWMDPERVGVFGWSYGGYVSALSILQSNSMYRAAVSVAPVTDWALYDTHYTERYLGTPQMNPQGYERASVVARLAGETGLSDGQRALLLVHGMADDNVLFAHTLKLMEGLQNAGLPFQMMAYPGRAHGLVGRETQRHLYRNIVDFFDRELKE